MMIIIIIVIIAIIIDEYPMYVWIPQSAYSAVVCKNRGVKRQQGVYSVG